MIESIGGPSSKFYTFRVRAVQQFFFTPITNLVKDMKLAKSNCPSVLQELFNPYRPKETRCKFQGIRVTEIFVYPHNRTKTLARSLHGHCSQWPLRFCFNSHIIGQFTFLDFLVQCTRSCTRPACPL